MYMSLKYQHYMYVDIHHHRIYEFVGISNFMLFVNKQNKHLMPPQMQESSVYMHVMLVLTIIMESWHSNIVFNYDTLAQQHKHLAVLGVWFQSMPLLLNTDWTKLLNLTVLVMGQKWK